MCTKEEFARLRDVVKGTAEQSAENSRQIAALQKADAVQSEQLKTLFNTTEKQGASMFTMMKMLVAALVCLLILVVLALIFGALGKEGFNGVTKAAPTLLTSNPPNL